MRHREEYRSGEKREKRERKAILRGQEQPNVKAGWASGLEKGVNQREVMKKDEKRAGDEERGRKEKSGRKLISGNNERANKASTWLLNGQALESPVVDQIFPPSREGFLCCSPFD